MSSFVVAFTAFSGEKVPASVRGAFRRHLSEKVQPIKNLGVDMPGPSVTEVWTNSTETVLIIVYIGGTAQMAGGFQSVTGCDTFAAVPENFRTSGQYTQVQN
jgi:hypothetical protein